MLSFMTCGKSQMINSSWHAGVRNIYKCSAGRHDLNPLFRLGNWEELTVSWLKIIHSSTCFNPVLQGLPVGNTQVEDIFRRRKPVPSAFWWRDSVTHHLSAGKMYKCSLGPDDQRLQVYSFSIDKGKSELADGVSYMWHRKDWHESRFLDDI